MERENSSPTVSIIVPVYNTQSYLRNCIDSVLRQEYQNWELILVDDGSTDVSGRICDEYAEKDSRIRVLHKPNSGVSDTRNQGLDMANGEWIFFLDSDDELYPYSLSSLINWSIDCDMVVSVYKLNVIDPERMSQKKLHNTGKKAINEYVDSKGFLLYLINSKNLFSATVFPKLYKNKILKNNNLRFSPDIYYAEDQLFVAKYICCKETNKIHINNIVPTYQYNIRPDSATGNYNAGFNDRIFTDFVGYFEIFNLCKNHFNNNRINRWTTRNAYHSGRHIIDLMNNSHNVKSWQRSYVENNMKIIEENCDSNRLEHSYIVEKGINEIKEKGKDLDRVQRIQLVNDWFHSDSCFFSALNLKWKILYLISNCLGTRGVKLFVDKMKFDN